MTSVSIGARVKLINSDSIKGTVLVVQLKNDYYGFIYQHPYGVEWDHNPGHRIFYSKKQLEFLDA